MAHCYLCKEHNHVHLLVFCLAVVCLCFCLFVFNHDYGKNLIAGTLNNYPPHARKGGNDKKFALFGFLFLALLQRYLVGV